MANVICSKTSTPQHLWLEGFSSTIIDSYTPPDINPTGIDWDESNVLSVDSIADKHYKHSGFSGTITSSYTSPGTTPWGIGWDGTNVLSTDYAVDDHFKHNGFSNTITSSYNSPGTNPRSIVWDGTNVLSTDSSSYKHYKHNGFSNTITSSYDAPDHYTAGIGWDGANVVSVGVHHYKHSGFSSTILSSYDIPYADRGIAWETSPGTGYDVALTLAIELATGEDEQQLNTTYTTIPIVRKRLKYLDTDISDTDIEQFIVEAEGIIDAIMKDSLLTIFDNTKHGTIRKCASDMAALMCIGYDPSNYPTIEAANMTADFINTSLQECLIELKGKRNVVFWKSL